jgi:integrase/recombinase XerD
MANKTSPKQMAAKFIKLLKKEQNIDVNYLRKTFEHVRNELNIHRPSGSPKKLPQLLTEDEMRRFYDAVWEDEDSSHMIMVKLLLYTGVRNSELVNIKLEDVDLKAMRIHIHEGKGKKDRLVPVPILFRDALSQYMNSRKAEQRKNLKDSSYLFQTNRNNKYSTRWVREIIKRYATKAGIEKRIYPHLFRHHLLTFLTNEKLIDAKIQIISGHSDRQSLSKYQDLSLVDVESEYQEAMKRFPL